MTLMENDTLRIAGREFRSRLIVGTGKYKNFQEMARAHEASGAEIVTVAVRRVNLTDKTKESLLDYIARAKYFIPPNTAGCYTADEAVRAARLAREAGLSNWVKLEVIGDEKTLFPDNFELLKATAALVREGFVVLPYTNDDLIAARRLIEAGAAAVMPLGAPIGSGLGIQNPGNIRIMREMITDRKSTRLNSSHTVISYAVFCLKKKKKKYRKDNHVKKKVEQSHKPYIKVHRVIESLN